MSELHGQLPLFSDIHAIRVTTVKGRPVYELTGAVTGHVGWQELAFSRQEEPCERCGTPCISVRECDEARVRYEEGRSACGEA